MLFNFLMFKKKVGLSLLQLNLFSFVNNQHISASKSYGKKLVTLGDKPQQHRQAMIILD